jgi:hypothetical protein
MGIVYIEGSVYLLHLTLFTITIKGILRNVHGKKLVCWYRRPDVGTSSIDWAQLSRFFPEDGDRNQLPIHCVLNKNRTLDNVQKRNICIIVASSQTFTTYLHYNIVLMRGALVFVCTGYQAATLVDLER